MKVSGKCPYHYYATFTHLPRAYIVLVINPLMMGLVVYTIPSTFSNVIHCIQRSSNFIVIIIIIIIVT